MLASLSIILFLHCLALMEFKPLKNKGLNLHSGERGITSWSQKGRVHNHKNPQAALRLCFLVFIHKSKQVLLFPKTKNPQLALWVFFCGERGTRTFWGHLVISREILCIWGQFNTISIHLPILIDPHIDPHEFFLRSSKQINRINKAWNLSFRRKITL